MEYDNIKLLNLEDFDIDISKFEVTKNDNTLYCHITLLSKYDPCPLCGNTNSKIHDYRLKKIVHSISTNCPCFILYKARRYKCPNCNNVYYEYNPFSSVSKKTSTFTRITILNALRSHTSTFTSVGEQFNVSKNTVINIFDEYVNCSRRTLPMIMCIDEVYTAKISSTKYACVLLDFQTKKVVEVYSSRHKYFLSNRFTLIPKAERDNVKAIIIDMWDTYNELAHIYFKNAIVAVDSFHVIKQLNDAMIKVRIKIMNKYNTKTNRLIDNDMYYYMLKKFHYFFVKNYEDIYSGYIKINKINAKWKKDEILKYLLSIDDDLKKAYILKEKYREFNSTASYNNCDDELESLINEFNNSTLDEFRDFGRLIRNWKKEIKNSFIRINSRRLSNGAMEGVNFIIKTIIKNANGFTNFGRLRNKIMYSINKDEPIKGNPKK